MRRLLRAALAVSLSAAAACAGGVGSVAPAPVPVCADTQFVNRFVSVDSTILRLDRGGDLKFGFLVVGAQLGNLDTALVWQQRRFYGTRVWELKLQNGDTVTVAADRVEYRKLRPDSETQAAFAPFRSEMPCFTDRQLAHFKFPPPPYELTYDDAIIAGMEASYVTFPFWFTAGFPTEPHVDRSNGTTVENLGLMFEATIAPPFLIHVHALPFAVAITPKVVIRQLQGGSAPVPPPSYMPRGTIYYWSWPFNKLRGRDRRKFPYAWLMVSHHSNGQEGHPEDPVTGGANYYDGNFSTNFTEFGVSLNNSRATSITSYFLSWQHNDPHWTDSHHELLGHNRYRAGVQGVIPGRGANSGGGFGRYRLDVWYIDGPMKPAFDTEWKRVAVSATVAWRPPLFHDWSLFANAYSGQDYYNMRYDRVISMVRVGALVNQLQFKFEIPYVP